MWKMDILYTNESLKLLKYVYNIQQRQSHLEKKLMNSCHSGN